MHAAKRYRDAVTDCWRFVTFRSDAELYDRVDFPHLVIGFITTWLVGIGRNWDFPEAPLYAKLGLPSLFYIFILSLVFFLTSWPVSQSRLSYWKILTLVSMTSVPGLIYAIPVEAMFGIDAAQVINLCFLGLVALWRVLLAYSIFMKAGANSLWVTTSIILTPICVVVLGLVSSGRAGYVMEIMGGLNRPQNQNTGVDDAIAVLYCLAWPVLVVSVLVWLGAVISPGTRRKPQ